MPGIILSAFYVLNNLLLKTVLEGSTIISPILQMRKLRQRAYSPTVRLTLKPGHLTSLPNSAASPQQSPLWLYLCKPRFFRSVSPGSQKCTRGNSKIFWEKVPANQDTTFWISFIHSKKKYIYLGTSLAVQWLRLPLPMQGVWVWSLVGELRSHMPHGQKTKT